MDINVQEFPRSPWSFAKVQRCLSYVTCNFCFLDNISAIPAFSFLSSNFMTVNKSTSLTLLESLKTMVIWSMLMPQLSVVGSSYSRELQKFSSINMFFKKLPLSSWSHCLFPSLWQKAKMFSQTVFRVVPRAHYLWVSTDECRIGACHFQELPTSLSKSLPVVQDRGHSTAFFICISSILWVSSVSERLVSCSFTPRTFSSSSTCWFFRRMGQGQSCNLLHHPGNHLLHDFNKIVILS